METHPDNVATTAHPVEEIRLEWAKPQITILESDIVEGGMFTGIEPMGGMYGTIS